MPDDRLFHPRLLQSDKVERLTDFERGVWFVSRLVCDDFGVVRFSPNTLQQAARFLEKKPLKTIHKALLMIRSVGLLATFDHEGREYAYQWDWQDWQKVNYPRGTLQPSPTPEALACCTVATRELFTKHPGGWGRKKHETVTERSAPVSETVQERSENVFPKPLAVSRKPLAVSHQPVIAASDARSKRPIYTCERFAVHEWQLDEISKMLGPHYEAFGLDAFFDALGRQATADGLVIAKTDVWPWLQAQVLAEAKRRGLPMAGTAPVRDKDAEIAAQNALVLAKIQQDRENRSRYAGR